MNTPSAIGYELSIYDQYPNYFWYFLIAAISCGISILIHQAWATDKSKWWVVGLYIIIFVNLIIILLPVFREYFISGAGDEITHLGFIKDISLTNHIAREDIYPISHILSFDLLSIIGLDSKLVIKVVPSIFYLIYLAGLYLLSNFISDNFGQTLLVMAFSSVLLFTYFQYLFLPTQFSLFLVPLILFLFFKKASSTSISNTATFLMMVIIMPFLHPLGTILLLAILMILALLNPIFRLLKKRYNIKIKSCILNKNNNVTPILFIIVIFFMWFANFAVFNSTLYQAYDWFVNGYGTPSVVALTETIQTNFSFIEFAVLLIKTYGHNFIFSFFSLGAIYFILRKAFLRQSSQNFSEIFFSLVFLFFCVFYVSTLMGSFIGTGNSQRLFCWALMASTVLNGIVFHEWLSKSHGRNSTIGIVLISIMIIIAATIGIFSVYPSPYIMKPNIQLTLVDWTGMEWFFDNKNNDDTMCFDQLPQRAPHFIYGFGLYDQKEVGNFHPVPPHIGYDKYKNISASFGSDTYIVVSELIRTCKEQLWQNKGTYTLRELNRIDFDIAVNKIYSDRGLDIYYVLHPGNGNGEEI